MRELQYLKNVAKGLVLSMLILAGTVLSIDAQVRTREYADWQHAVRTAENAHSDYLRTHRAKDYRQWQAAERLSRQRYRRYQATAARGHRRTISGTGNSQNTTGIEYRVYRDGAVYATDARGAELLRQAVRSGFAEGNEQGHTDKKSSRPYDYTLGTMYRNGTYGFQPYVDREQYQYYFRQGFQRGYEDGFNGTYKYGTATSNGFEILESMLNAILNIAQ